MRVQDARLQQLIVAYQDAVRQAAREADDAASGLLKSLERETILREGTVAANRSLSLANSLYREGYSDFQRALAAQQDAYPLGRAFLYVMSWLSYVYRGHRDGIGAGMDCWRSEAKIAPLYARGYCLQGCSQADRKGYAVEALRYCLLLLLAPSVNGSALPAFAPSVKGSALPARAPSVYGSGFWAGARSVRVDVLAPSVYGSNFPAFAPSVYGSAFPLAPCV